MNDLTIIDQYSKELPNKWKEAEFDHKVNCEVPKNWIKKHPFAKVDYLPIDKVEFLMTYTFGKWNVEVKEVSQLFNSVAVCVRVHYRHPVSNEMTYQDGVGAVGIQTDKGASASDMGAIKSDAVMKALPSAKSYAIKDACEHIGRIFGRDLNRPDAIAFQLEEKVVTEREQLIELFNLKHENLDAQMLNDFNRIINNNEFKSYAKAIKTLQEL